MYNYDMINNKNYTVKQLSKHLNVSERTILRELNSGKMESVRVGRKHLISESELNRYLHRESSSISKKVGRYFQEKNGEMVDLLHQMVSLPSVGYKANQGEQLAKFIVKTLEGRNIRSVFLKEGDAIAVRASYGWAEKGIVIDCPLDTAPVGDIDKWKYPPFGGVIKAGKMYGRGTADCKAGIVAAIFTLLALKKFVDEKKVRVELVFDGGEQDGSYKGMKMVIKRGLHANAGIIGYAGDEFDFAIGCRGYHRYTFKTLGRSAHTGSRYNVGVNAIEKMAKFISEMKKAKLNKSEAKHFPFGQKMTFSLIEGGREINIVPDECTTRLDFRTTPDYSKDYVDRLIKTNIKIVKSKDKKFQIEWKYDLGNEGYVVDEKEEIVKSLKKSIKQVYKKSPAIVANGPSHIGTLLTKEGVPTVVWGPRGGNVHSYNEYVEINSIPKTSLIYLNSVLDYFGLC